MVCFIRTPQSKPVGRVVLWKKRNSLIDAQQKNGSKASSSKFGNVKTQYNGDENTLRYMACKKLRSKVV